MEDRMDVVYACDDRYAMLAGVSLISLLETNKDFEEIAIHILTTGVSDANKGKLTEISRRYEREIRFAELTEDLLPHDEVNAQRWSVAAFARLFSSDLLPDRNRILYLDCDIIINGSLKNLWKTPLNGNTCAAVAEMISPLHKKNVGLEKTDVYYNSGVMLIDLQAWRDMNAKELFIASIRRHSGKVPYVDQGVINEVFRNHITSLPARYNVRTEYEDFSYEEVQRYRNDKNLYSREEVMAAKENPVIIHYTSSFLTPRPWTSGSTHPRRGLWEKYFQMSPWRNSEQWPDNPGRAKLALRWIFTHCGRNAGLEVAKITNSLIRPLLDRNNIQ